MQQYAAWSLNDLSPFKAERQLYIYETLQYRAYTLWASPTFKLVRQIQSQFGKPGTYLSIFDKNGDGTPDLWIYTPPDQTDSEDWGLMFDLNQDRRMDYFIFNGGTEVTQAHISSLEQFYQHLFWLNYHWINSNYDGYVDINVLNDIDLNGDQLPDKGITAWLYDNDFDGRVDRAEYRGYTALFPIMPQDENFWSPVGQKLLTVSIPLEGNVFAIKRAHRVVQADREKFDIRMDILSELTKLP